MEENFLQELIITIDKDSEKRSLDSILERYLKMRTLVKNLCKFCLGLLNENKNLRERIKQLENQVKMIKKTIKNEKF